MATLQSILSGMTNEALKSEISKLEGIILMKRTGASVDEILEKYNSYPDNPERDLTMLVSELKSRGLSYTPKRGVGFDPSKEGLSETPVFKKSLFEIIGEIIGDNEMVQQAKERRLERDMVRSARSISRAVRSGELTPEQAEMKAKKKADKAVRQAGYDPESEKGIKYAEKMEKAQERGRSSALSSAIRMLQAERKDDAGDVSVKSESGTRNASGCQSII